MQKNRAHVLRLCTDAMLAALYVLLKSVLRISLPPVLEISFSSLPILLAAFLFGAPDALAVAFCGSLADQIIGHGISVSTPIWMAPVLLLAVAASLPGLFARRQYPLWRFYLYVFLAELTLTAANTAALYIDGAVWGYAVAALTALLPARLLNGFARAVLSCVVLSPLLLALSKSGIGRCPFRLPGHKPDDEGEEEE